MGQRRRQTDGEQLDQLRALLLRANALRAGYDARLAAPPRAVESHRRRARAVPAAAHALDLSLEKNRLHCTLRGFFGVAQAESLLLELQFTLTALRPGFDVVADVSRLGAVAPPAFPLLRRMATAFVEAGMRRMVRVVGSAPGAANSLARAAEGLYEARVVASNAEAARLLDADVGHDVPHGLKRRGPGRRRDGGRS